MRSLLLLLAGCTFTPGAGFVTLTGASLDAQLVPGAARDLGEGWILTDQGHAIRLDTAELRIDEVLLEELRGAEGVDFDPADPPAGYTLCHAGHCHSVTGELVDYIDVEAELAGAAAEFVLVSTLPVDRWVDLLDASAVSLEPQPAELPLGAITRVAVQLEEVRLIGVTETEDGEAPLSITLPWDATFSAGTDIPIDRDQAARLALEIALEVDGTLLDALDLTEGLVLTDPEDPRALAVLERLLNTPLEITTKEMP